MKHAIKSVALALGATLMLSALGVAEASAHEFVASKIGKIKGRGTTAQVYKTSAGSIECAASTYSGEMTAVRQESADIDLLLTSCTAFGHTAEVSQSLELLDSAGAVSIKSTILIKVPVAGCEIKMEPIVANQGLEGVVYKNSAGKILVESKVSGITYTSSGGLCGESGTKGSHTGSSELELEGGTIEWI